MNTIVGQSMKSYKVVPLARLLAVRLYQLAHDDQSDGRVYESDIGKIFRTTVPKNFLMHSAKILVGDGVISRRTDRNSDEKYYILTTDGLIFVENNVEQDNDMSLFYKHGESVLEEVATVIPGSSDDSNDGSEESVIPASDRTVTLNHNQSDYQQAVEALDKVLEEFRNDHRLDNELGHEKDALLLGLQGGRKLLNDTQVSAALAQSLIFEPLKRLMVRYEKELVAAAAATALALLMKIFGF